MTRSSAADWPKAMACQPEDEDLIEDWGQSIDDAGPEFYENLVGTLQDQVESLAESFDLSDQSYEYDDEEHLHRNTNTNVDCRVAWDNATRRKVEILQWLVTSSFAQALRDGWFGIAPCRHGRLRSGRRVKLVSWLLEERIHEGNFGWEVQLAETAAGLHISVRAGD